MTHVNLPTIWHLARPAEHIQWDEAIGFVLVAETEDTARTLAASNAMFEGSTVWLTPTLSACIPIGIANDPTPRVILRSYHPG